VSELTIPIKYRPRGTTGGYAPPLTPPSVECLGLTLAGERAVTDSPHHITPLMPRIYYTT